MFPPNKSNSADISGTSWRALKCSEPKRPESEAGFDATSHFNMFFWEMKSESFWTPRYNFHESVGIGINDFTFLGCNVNQARPWSSFFCSNIASQGTLIISNNIYHVVLYSPSSLFLWSLKHKRGTNTSFFLRFSWTWISKLMGKFRMCLLCLFFSEGVKGCFECNSGPERS